MTQADRGGGSRQQRTDDKLEEKKGRSGRHTLHVPAAVSCGQCKRAEEAGARNGRGQKGTHERRGIGE